VAAIAGFRIGRARATSRLTGEAEAAQAELARRVSAMLPLQELSYLLSESLEPNRIVEHVVQYVSRALDSSGTMVALTTEGGAPIRVVAAEGSLRSLAGRELAEADAGLIAAAIGSEHVEVAHAEAGQTPELVSGFPIQVAAVAPLQAHGITVGALACVRANRTPYTAEELRQLSTVSGHTAVVLENARFFGLIKTGKEQWEATFDAMRDGVAVVDGAGQIRRANRALARMLDLTLPAIIGQDIGAKLLGKSHLLFEHLDAVRAGESPALLTTYSDVLQRTLRISASAMPSDEDGLVVALIEDVTERRAIESQLIQSEKMAAIGQLVSGVAHELNNPLSSIAGLSDYLLHREGTTPAEKKHFSLIHEQAERAGRIVRNLLTFARQGPADASDADLNDIAQRAAWLVSYDLKLREIELEMDLADPPPRVRGDRHELQQVVLNLLTNAIQAVKGNDEGEPRLIRVSVHETGGQVELRVADTGPGIPEDLASQIFMPFFTTKAPGEGTGLGLSISYRIIEHHGGKISVRQAEGGGTEFMVSLPVANDEAGAVASPLATADVGPSPLDGGKTILLVDDDAAVLKSLSIMFAEDGHTVHEAQDADDAIELLSRQDYDLLIAEPRASLAGGAMLADALHEQLPGLKDRTLLLTADVRPETENWLRGLEFRYAKKPISARDLRTAVAELLTSS
jgi:two-component system NtrC family sensor kinase